jgi:hypothetical protein
MLLQKQIVDSWNVSQDGAFDDVADLTASVASPRVGDYAIVGKPDGVLYYWDGQVWTTPSSSDVPGVYAGVSTTFTGLPTTRSNATALVVGDWAMLPVIDGTNLPGVYKWDGSAWVMDTSFADDETSGATLPDPNASTYAHFLLFGSVDSLNGWYRREGTAGAHYWIQVTSAQKASLDLWGKGAELPDAATTDMVAFLKTEDPSRGFYERVNNYWVMVLGS